LKPFLIAYSLFVLVVSAVLIVFSKETSFLMINGWHTDFGDLVFPFITHLGGGFISGLVVVVFLFISYRWVIICSVSFVVTGLITQLLKRTVFADCVRPMKFFADNQVVHTVPGVDMHMYNSFPSGHTTVVFSLFFILALTLKGQQRGWGILFLLLAVLGGYSRIYLGQHFPEDVLAGSLIGVLVTYLCYFLVNSLLRDRKWAQRGLFKKAISHE